MYHKHRKRCKSTLLRNIPLAWLTDAEADLLAKQQGYVPDFNKDLRDIK